MTESKSDKTVVITMLSGLFAGSLAKLFTHPLDTLKAKIQVCLLYTSPSPRDRQKSRMPSSA